MPYEIEFKGPKNFKDGIYDYADFKIINGYQPNANLLWGLCSRYFDFSHDGEHFFVYRHISVAPYIGRDFPVSGRILHFDNLNKEVRVSSWISGIAESLCLDDKNENVLLKVWDFTKAEFPDHRGATAQFKVSIKDFQIYDPLTFEVAEYDKGEGRFVPSAMPSPLTYNPRKYSD